MTVKDRIQQYIEYKGISVYRLEASAELSKGYWAKTKSISADVVMKISRIYPDLSTEWLLRGEGQMIKDKEIKFETPFKEDSSPITPERLMNVIESQQKTIEILANKTNK